MPLKLFNKIQEKEICKLYLDGFSALKIGKIFKCSDGTIFNILKQNKISRRNPGFYQIKKYINLNPIINYFNGDMLGDGHLRNINKKQPNSLLAFDFKHEGMAKYIVRQYNKCGIYMGIKKTIRHDKRNQKKYLTWRLQSERNSSFTKEREKWYPKGIKIVPKNLKLAPKTCLNWYLEDGNLCKEKFCIVLCTDSFVEKEIKFLMNKFKEINIKTTKIKYKKNKLGIMMYRIRFSRIEARKFLDYIGPCPIDCYQYKWNWKESKFITKKILYLKKIKSLMPQKLSNYQIRKLTGIHDSTVEKYKNLINNSNLN